MAKKETTGAQLSLDDYDFGSEFDFDEFDIQPKPPKNKREAIERVASGALEGAVDAVKSPTFFREMIRKALPRGYGNMLDVADKSASSIRDLYNEGAKQIKPALKETAKVVDRLLPAGSDKAPKAVQKLARKFVDANKDNPQVGPGAGNATDMAVAGILQDTFNYNATQDAKRAARGEVKEGIQEAIQRERHVVSMTQLEGIRKGVVSMAAYQRRIEFGFQKKSLELQARHYYVAVDTLNEQKRQNLRTTEHLQAIMNNTSLPDILKMKASEKFMDMMRNKAFNGLQDGIFGQRSNFMENIGKAFRDQAMASVTSFAGGLRDGASGVESSLDASQMAAEMGAERFRTMGSIAGSTGAGWVAGLGATRLGRRIQEGGNGRMSGVFKGIRRLGNRLQYGAENLPQIANDFSNSARDGEDYIGSGLDSVVGDRLSDNTKRNISGVGGAILNPILDLVRGTVRRANVMDNDVKSSGVGNAQSPSLFTNQAHKSIVEVIPGYLARIWQELQITRTGDTSIDLPQYDFNKNAFSSTKVLRKEIHAKLFDETSRKGVKQEQDRLLELVDPQGKLNPEQRSELAKILMNDNLRGRAGRESGRINNYTDEGHFNGSANGSKFAELFKALNKRNKAEGEGGVEVDFANRFRNVGASMKSRNNELQRLLEIYPRDTLEDMGILKPGSDKIDTQQIQRYFSGDEYTPRGVQAIGGFRRLGGRNRGPDPQPQQGPPLLPPPTPPVPTPGDPQPAPVDPLIEKLQQLIDLTETQNSKPLVSDIKDILLAMQQAARDGNTGAPQGPSRVDQLRDLAGSASSAALRLRRKAQVTAGRLQQKHQTQIDAARARAEELLGEARTQGEQLAGQAGKMARRARRQAVVQAGRLRQGQQGNIDQLQDFAQRQLQRGQEMWNDRPSLEQLRDMLSERLQQARTQAGPTVQGWRERIRAFGEQAAEGANAAGERIRQGVRQGAERLRETRVGGDDTNDLLGQIKQVLLDIHARLEDGILTTSIPADGQMPGGMIRRAAGATRRGIGRLNMRITDVAKGMFKLSKGVVNLGASAANSLVSGGVKTLWKVGKGAAGLAGDAGAFVVSSQYRRARGFVDIYVGSERKPRMYGRLLQEGNVYFDQATGKPIKRMKDITGTVVKRSDGVDEVVLEANEIEMAYQRMGPIKKSLKMLGASAKGIFGIGKKLTNAVLGGIPPVFRAAWTVAKKVWGLLDMAQDIFVKDQLDSPAMTARIMRAGGYRSAVTGNIISRPSKIDGPVLSGDETVLTHDDIRKGLVDKNNKPIRTGLNKLLNFAFGGIKRFAKVARKVAEVGTKAAMSTIKGGIKLGGKLVKGGVTVAGGMFDLARGRNPFSRQGRPKDLDAQTVQVAAESNSILKEIRDLLRDRLPEKTKVAGDLDGDGDRDGSYEDQMKQKAEADKAKAQQNAAGQEPGVAGDKKGFLASLWAKLRGKKDEDEESDDGDTNIDVGGNGDSARDKKRARRMARRPGGSWGTSQGWKGKAKFLAGKGLGGLKTAGKFGLGLLGSGLGVGSMLGGAGSLLAGAGSAIAGGAAAIGGALSAGAAAVAGVVSLPVVLGVAAVAAVGVGAYYGYKYLTRKTLGLLSRPRYAQYGFIPSDTDHVAAVFGLEDKLKDAVVYGKEGAKLDAKRVDIKGLLKDFDVDEDDKRAMANFTSWFATRFKPVFLTHVTALKGIAPSKWLSDVDDLEPALALQYLNAIRFPEGPYNQETSPFKDLKALPAGAGDVKMLLQIATDELQKKSKTAGKAGVGATVVSGAAAAAAATSADGKPKAAQVGTASGVSKEVLAAAAAGATMGMGVQGGAQVGVSGSGTVLNSLGVDRLDAIDVVRMKSYGLVQMETDKVRALMALEKSVNANLTFSKNVAAWTGSLEQILSANGAAFGVDITNEGMASNWLSWFNQRFLPVYLNFATLIKAQTGKDVPMDGKTALKSTQLVDVATGIFTTSGSRGSVWNVSASPWADYELNTDVRSTDGNMQGLKDMAKNAILAEPGGKGANQPTASKSSANTSTPESTVPKLGGALGWAWGGIKSMASGVKDAVTSFASGPPVGGPPSGGAPGTMGGGREASHPGKGTGGDINSIPKPTGNKSWGALKDTILAAAKMVGVDGKLMAAMAAIESGFDHTVKAGTSSATGLYQFIKGTWDSMLRKYGAKYGIAPGTPATDPRANALMGAEYIKDNMAALDGKLNRPLTDTDVYFAHFLGSGGAKKFLSASPDAIGAQILPDAAGANRGIFYDKAGAPLTVSQIYQLVNGRVQNKAKGFGINDGGESMVESKPAPAVAKGGEVPAAGGGAASASVAGTPDAGKTPATTPAPTSAKSPYAVGSSPTVTSSVPPSQAPAPATAPVESAPVGPNNRGVSISSITAGFMPPRSMADQMSAQKQMQEIRVSNLADTNRLLEESKDIQGKMLVALNTIAGNIGKVAAPAQAANQDATPTSQQTRATERRASELPRAPVNVSRPRAPF